MNVYEKMIQEKEAAIRLSEQVRRDCRIKSAMRLSETHVGNLSAVNQDDVEGINPDDDMDKTVTDYAKKPEPTPKTDDATTPVGRLDLQDLDKIKEGEHIDKVVDEKPLDLTLFKPIAFGESNVRITTQQGKSLISESDFEAVCHHYKGRFSAEEIIEMIAECHQIKTDDLYVMMTESEAMAGNVKIAVSTIGNSNPDLEHNRSMIKMARLQEQTNIMRK